MTLTIYTDGAAIANGQPCCRSSYGFYCIENEYCESGDAGYDGHHTSNTGELTAIYKAIQYALREKAQSVIVYSDSQYSINSLIRWDIEKKTQGKPKANYDLIKEIQQYMKNSGLHIDIMWVKGHSGNFWNEQANFLAESYLRTAKPLKYKINHSEMASK
jgi:ribonuclease HI